LLASLFIFSAIYLLRSIGDTKYSFPDLSSITDPNHSNPQAEAEVLPPLFEEWNKYERNLPQHDESLPPPEGRSARFLYIADHAHGVFFFDSSKTNSASDV
jgi:hypothetical protein